MKWWQVFLALFTSVCLYACDDPSDNALCKMECGQGTCAIGASGSEKCVCHEGYTFDLVGLCTKCVEGYSETNGKCIKDPCTDFCKGANEECKLTGTSPSCSCISGYEKLDGVCSPTSKCDTHFVFNNTGAIGFKVFVSGQFDNWEHKQYELVDEGGGNFKISIALSEGSYEYKFFVEGWNDEWQTDPNRPTQGNDNNNVVKVGACGEDTGGTEPIDGDAPALVLVAQPSVNSGNVNFEVKYVDGADAAGIKEPPSVTRAGASVSSTFDQGSLTLSVTDTGLSNNKYAYFVTATSKNGKTAKLYVPVWVQNTPFDWRDGVLYFAFIDRFLNGNSANDNPKTDATHNGTCDARWMGGDFAGLKQKVESGYFDDLGVNTLWISSVSMNGQGTGKGSDQRNYSAYHSYWPVASGWTEENASMFTAAQSSGIPIQAIEPHFGTMEEFKQLVDACHKRGIRVLVDYAANHVHEDSPLYINHKDWFNTNPIYICDQGNWDTHPIECWFAENLPDFNYEKPEVRKLMVDHAKWLIQETNIDGFRVDAVKHMTTQFIKDLRKGIDAMLANTGITFYMVGETFDYSAENLKKYIGPNMLHGQFDFGFYGQLTNNILKDNGNFGDAKNFTEGNDHQYDNVNGAKALMGTFLGNHDVARAITVAANNTTDKWASAPNVDDAGAHLRLKLAWTVLLTSPGIPLFYYGDEYGLEGAGDPDNRRMMQFENLRPEQQTTLGFVKLLGQIRKNNPVLSRGTRTNLAANNEAWIYKMSDGQNSIWVGVCRGYANFENLPAPANGWTDLLNNNQEIASTSRIELKAGFQIFVWKEKP